MKLTRTTLLWLGLSSCCWAQSHAQTQQVGSEVRIVSSTTSYLPVTSITRQLVSSTEYLPGGLAAGQLKIVFPKAAGTTKLLGVTLDGVSVFSGDLDLGVAGLSLNVSASQKNPGQSVQINYLLETPIGGNIQISSLRGYGQDYASVIGDQTISLTSPLAPTCPTPIFAGAATISRGYSINGIYGTPLVSKLGIGILGNSFASPNGDAQQLPGDFRSYRGLGAAALTLDRPFATFGEPGSIYQGRKALYESAYTNGFKEAGIHYIVLADGHNVLRDGSQSNAQQRFAILQADTLDFLQFAQTNGFVPLVNTITPITASWMINTTVQETDIARNLYNTWIRSGAAGEFYDMDDAVSENGIWKAGYTTDGIHMSTTGYRATSDRIVARINSIEAAVAAPEPSFLILFLPCAYFVRRRSQQKRRG
jgi:hypothetical protein